MKDRAYAKINLALDVFNVREDGYHDINSIMVPINFYDELEINISDNDNYTCNKSFIRFNEKNSIIKMINVVKERYNITDHFSINLRKTVPIQAGLGGGTADAASTLRILKKMYNLHLTKEDEKQICISVGSDVLFNYYNKPAIVTGIGDCVEVFDMAKDYFVLIVKPRSGVSTKDAYNALDMSVCDHPDIAKLKNALTKGEEIKGLLGNSLEQPALLLNKDVREIKDLLLSSGADNVLMSGSGSSVFVISENNSEIENLYDLIKNNKYYTRLTKTKAN